MSTDCQFLAIGTNGPENNRLFQRHRWVGSLLWMEAGPTGSELGDSVLRNLIPLATITGLALLCTATPTSAGPISFQTVLTGDARSDGPDGLKVMVSVLGDANDPTITKWTVDLIMDDTYPSARLDEFGFNLVSPVNQYSVLDISPTYTAATHDQLQGYGGGNVKFLLTLDDPNGSANDATNITSLTFALKKSTAFALTDFLNAPGVCSNELGCNQMAVHIVGLNEGAGGIASGDYDNVAPVPEPASMVLLGSGAIAAALARRRRKV